MVVTIFLINYFKLRPEIYGEINKKVSFLSRSTAILLRPFSTQDRILPRARRSSKQTEEIV